MPGCFVYSPGTPDLVVIQGRPFSLGSVLGGTVTLPFPIGDCALEIFPLLLDAQAEGTRLVQWEEIDHRSTYPPPV